MKHKFSTNRFSYGLTTRTHRNVLTWAKPDSVSERSKRPIENILRWEDDGGPVSEARDQLAHVTETNTPQRTAADE